MKKICYPMLTLLFVFSACNDESISKEQELKSLQRQLSEIMTMAKSVNCDDPEDWTFTAYGSKACGGPQGFIAYSLIIETNTFLKKIEAYRVAEEEFNKKWGVVSDCAIALAPIDVTCNNGEAMLIYESQ